MAQGDSSRSAKSKARNFTSYAEEAGFDEDEADQFVEAVIEFLVAKVRAARRAEPFGTAYQDVNVAMADVGQRRLDFGNPAELRFMGAILAEVNDRTRDQIGALLSSWILHKRAGLGWQADDIVGVGFYNYVIDRQVYLNGKTLTKKSDDIAREMCLIEHIKTAHAYYHR